MPQLLKPTGPRTCALQPKKPMRAEAHTSQGEWPPLAETTESPCAATKTSIVTKINTQKNIYFCFTDSTEAFDCVDHNKLWTILKEMGIPNHLTCLLRNLYAGQEATVRTGHGTTDWFQVRKGVHQGILSPCLFNLYAEYIMSNAQAG